jgi:hypothetical protein
VAQPGVPDARFAWRGRGAPGRVLGGRKARNKVSCMPTLNRLFESMIHETQDTAGGGCATRVSIGPKALCSLLPKMRKRLLMSGLRGLNLRFSVQAAAFLQISKCSKIS